MFFPSVTDEKRDWMADLVRSVEWDCLEATTGATVLLGRGALAVELILPRDVASRLDDRLIRASDLGSQKGAIENYYRLRDEPLGQLALAQGEAQWEPRRRNHRHGRPLSRHVTFARYKKDAAETIPLHRIPKLEIPLPRVALYESQLGQTASTYEIIAESSQNMEKKS